MAGTHRINRTTLVGIADAIREYRGLDGSIPVPLLAEVLAGASVTETLPTATAEVYVIDIQQLIDIADVIREKSGTTGEIPVTSLAERIRALKPSYGTSAILGEAMLGYAILGTIKSIEKLGTPTIRLSAGLSAPTIYIEAVTEKLSTPEIYLQTADTPVEPEEPVKLSAPTIRIEEITDEEEEPDEPIEPEEPVKLSAPTIRIEEITETIPKLDKPSIYVYLPAPASLDLVLLDNKITWAAVDGATYYEVTGGGVTNQVDSTGDHSLDPYMEALGTGALTVGVRAGNQNAVSDYIEKSVEVYATPQNLQLNGSVLTWDEVAGAPEYRVRVAWGNAATWFVASTASVDLAELLNATNLSGMGEYPVSVKVHGDNATSLLSEEITYTE